MDFFLCEKTSTVMSLIRYYDDYSTHAKWRSLEALFSWRFEKDFCCAVNVDDLEADVACFLGKNHEKVHAF